MAGKLSGNYTTGTARRQRGQGEQGERSDAHRAKDVAAGKGAVQFTVGFKHLGNTGHLVVEAEDALIAALKVKVRHPEALITYVRRLNKRGDQRHPERDVKRPDEKR